MPDSLRIPAVVTIDPAALPGPSPELAGVLADVRRLLGDVRARLDTDSRIALTEREAAGSIGVSASLLAQMRARGEGPPYAKLGSRVIYPADGLREWLAARTAIVEAVA